jgi:pimeloyl-ACP methyl ester carboxylesterase
MRCAAREPSPSRAAVAVWLVSIVACACSDGDGGEGARPLPAPVDVRAEPEVELVDPAFEPLPGATADYGRIGGAVYRVEMPDDWNGRLVLWMHGFGQFAPEASVSAPDVRGYLIGQGWAWGASSFSSSSWIPGRAADETAAVWDYFARTYGRPSRTYVIGLSMGGAAAHIAAERYPDRFDGALGLCGAAGATPALAGGVDLFVAAAFVAGITQAEYDATDDVPALIDERIRPALRDPDRHDLFERIMVDLTGGPRPFDREGFHIEEETNLGLAELSVGFGLSPPREAPYRLGPLSGIADEEFNRAAVRLRTDDAFLAEFVAGNDLTGELRIPLLTMHTTGDGQVPIEQARILRRLVDAADRRDRLVQRVIRDASHCGFNSPEWAAGLEALAGWVERGAKPDGNDVLTDDLADLEPSFELLPRAGSAAAEAVPGARDRVVLRGSATLDGAAFEAQFLGAIVLHESGLVAACQYGGWTLRDGAYVLSVMGDAEVSGCGIPGARILVWTYALGQQLHATEALPWPGGGVTSFDVEFSSASPRGIAPVTMGMVGEVTARDGRYAPPGSRVEAFVGDTSCGVSSTRRTGNFSGFILLVAGPDAVPGCEAGAPLTFLVDGAPVAQTAIHQPGGERSLDLTLR